MGTIGAVLVVTLVSLLFAAMAVWPLVDVSDVRPHAPTPLRVVNTGRASEEEPKVA